MNRTWVNLAMKFVMLGVISVILLPQLSNASLLQSILIAAALTILAYAIGDAWVLPQFGNISATVADFVLAALTIWVLGMLARTSISIGDSLLVGAIIAVGEFFFHGYLAGTIGDTETAD